MQDDDPVTLPVEARKDDTGVGDEGANCVGDGSGCRVEHGC